MGNKTVYMKVELNQINYKGDDRELITKDAYDSIKIESSFGQWPSAVGWDAIMIYIVIPFVASGIASGFLNELGSDLYRWSKSKLQKITSDKEDFDETKFFIEMNDCTINIYCYDKEDLQYVTENFEKIMKDAVKQKRESDENIDIDVRDLK
ncbi:hypothetical protein AB4027_04700 [Alkalibacterium putridalgicola]|uniref:hypothetical protein n=1 Tax=Alkalibacterium putridalgicola TaxID=426703 RepID=UPI0034CE2644